jgi:hypothetical protein
LPRRGEKKRWFWRWIVSAVAKLNGMEMDRSIHGPLVEEIKAGLREFEDIRVTHVRRSCNVAAHRLAQLGCKNKNDALWEDCSPTCIGELLDCDLV